MSNWDRSYRFALANEMTQDRSWLGSFYKVAVYDRALTAEEVAQLYNADRDKMDFHCFPSSRSPAYPTVENP